MKKNLITLLGICLFLTSNAQMNNLRVSNPQSWWQSSNGVITDLDIEVTPIGSYFKYDMEITFATQNPENFYGQTQTWDISPELLFTNEDMVSSISNPDSIDVPLEIQYSFNLPKDAIVTDSWLWMNRQPIKAEIMDSWTATMIYESIVNRRRDPSLFKKNSATNYSLNIYPLNKNGSRKIKISILLPATWNGNKVQASLPTSLFKNVNFKNPKITIKCNTTEQWKNPNIPIKKLVTNNIFYTTIEDYLYTPYVEYDNPSTENSFLSVYKKGNESYFDLIVSPLEAKITNNPKNIIFVVDKIGSTSTYKNLIDELYAYAYKEIQNNSKINVIFDDGNINKLSSSWIETKDPLLLKNIFGSLKTDFNRYGYTLDLLKKAIELQEETGVNAEIILLSNVESYYQKNSIKEVVNTLLEDYDTLPSINIITYNSSDWYYNENPSNAFLEEIAKRINGECESLNKIEDLGSILNNVFSTTEVNHFDFSIEISNGLSFDVFDIAGTEALQSNSQIMQTGKFYGELPLVATLKYMQNNTLQEKTFTFDQANTFTSDSVLMQVWAGQKINASETYDYSSNYEKSEIVETSLTYRVLSTYTAFLAVEPTYNLDSIKENLGEIGNNNNPVTDGNGGFPTVGVDKVEENASKIQVKNSESTITVSIVLETNEIIESIELFDITGKKIKSFDTNASNIEIEKSGTTGVAILLIKTNKGSYYQKIIL